MVAGLFGIVVLGLGALRHSWPLGLAGFVLFQGLVLASVRARNRPGATRPAPLAGEVVTAGSARSAAGSGSGSGSNQDHTEAAAIPPAAGNGQTAFLAFHRELRFLPSVGGAALLGLGTLALGILFLAHGLPAWQHHPLGRTLWGAGFVVLSLPVLGIAALGSTSIRRGPCGLSLGDDALVLEDSVIFPAPIRIDRAQVSRVGYKPVVSFAGARTDEIQVGGTLEANTYVEFEPPASIPIVLPWRRGRRAREGRSATVRTVGRLYFRLEKPSDAERLAAWVAASPSR